MNDGYIYLISGIQGQGCYVGQTIDVNERWYRHEHNLDRNTGQNLHLQRAWVKYGSDSYAFVVVEQPSSQDLTEREQFWMDKLKSEGVMLYNLHPAAGSPLGYKHSDESRSKISKASKGRIPSEAARHNMSEAQKGNQHWLGLRHSEETRRKMSKAKKGKPLTEETKRKLSIVRHGRPWSEARRKAQKGRNNERG